MEKILLTVLVFLMYSQNSFAGKCPEIGDAFLPVRESNAVVVPATKYPTVKAKMEDSKCLPPAMIRIPNSVVIIDELLSKNKKIGLWVRGRDKEQAGILEARWQSLFLRFFSSSNNFSLVERARLEDILDEQARGQKGIMAPENLAKAMKLSGATHMLIVNGQRSQSGLFKTDYYTARLVDLETGRVLTVDEMED